LKVLVVTRAAGRSAVRKTVHGEWLRVGRNASCEIHLPDPRVSLEHGMIVNREGLVYLEGEPGSSDITRKSVRSVRLAPGQGVDVGPYRIEAQPAPEGYDGALEVVLARAPQAVADLAARTAELTIGSLGFTKRWAAWVWGILVLALFLALPAGRVLELPWSEQAQRIGFSDRFWNPGAVILAHQPFEQRCATCHQKAFQHVQDRACLECHHSIRQHVGPEMRPTALFNGQRCSTCHRDHKGIRATHRDDDGLCVGCHRDIRKKASHAEVADVSDFARDHPAFRLTIPGDRGVRRVRQGEEPIAHEPHLVFPHAVHLSRSGVRSPLQGRMRLECKSCHQPDTSARGFEPVSMQKHCQECHGLQFEPAVTAREVPHGNPALAVTAVEEFYANLALKGTRDSFRKAFGVAGEGLLRRPGTPTEAQRESALALAERKARKVTTELFEVRVCKTCHTVTREGEAWRVAPVRNNRQWMPHARFNHKAHVQTPCADCHDAARSKLATDVSMPTIETCRDCHGGSRPVEGKITSNCLLCHGFHDSRHPWDPGFVPKGSRIASASGDAH
jgi:predicted CXXCH cytochrome family protein